MILNAVAAQRCLLLLIYTNEYLQARTIYTFKLDTYL